MKENRLNIVLLTISVTLSIVTTTMNSTVVNIVNWVIFKIRWDSILLWILGLIVLVLSIYTLISLTYNFAISYVIDSLKYLKIPYKQVEEKDFKKIVNTTALSVLILMVGVTLCVIVLCLTSFFGIANSIIISIVLFLNTIILFNITRNVNKRFYKEVGKKYIRNKPIKKREKWGPAYGWEW